MPLRDVVVSVSGRELGLPSAETKKLHVSLTALTKWSREGFFLCGPSWRSVRTASLTATWAEKKNKQTKAKIKDVGNSWVTLWETAPSWTPLAALVRRFCVSGRNNQSQTLTRCAIICWTATSRCWLILRWKISTAGQFSAIIDIIDA